MSLSYADQLRDPRWQKKRLAVFERDGFRCRRCKSEDKQLHAHHMFYEKSVMQWDYPDVCIITLCDDCHYGLHGAMKLMGIVLGRIVTGGSFGSGMELVDVLTGNGAVSADKRAWGVMLQILGEIVDEFTRQQTKAA